MSKFATPAIAGIFVGWHLTPGFNFNGDYLVIPLSSFRDAPGRKTFHAFRIREVVSFDATNFPLQ